VINRLIDLTIQIQQIPAPTFEEAARADFVWRRFAAEGLADIHMDSAGNVLARLPGAGSDSPLVVSAHLDTVFPAGTDLAIRREPGRVYGPGIGDNSLGVAGLFGLVWALRERGIQLPGDLWLAANTCEEGLGDLRGMKTLVEHFAGLPKAYLVLEGMALGHVYRKAIGVRRYKITIHAPGGHSWTDYGAPSAIHELSKLVNQITALQLPPLPRTTLNIGRIGGGTSINTIAAEAWLELDLRSEGSNSLTDLIRRVEKLVDAAEQPGVRVGAEIIGQRPPGEIVPDHPLVRLAQACLVEQRIEPVLTTGSTDANIPLSQGYPALVLGLTRGGGAHTAQEFFETAPLAQGLEQLVQFVSRAWK
jgi:acetylornithine deacetylase/succinyl-diaminopimelate desuccinylase-like protein